MCVCVQVKDVMKDVMAGLQQTNSEKILLSWVRQNTRQYPEVRKDWNLGRGGGAVTGSGGVWGRVRTTGQFERETRSLMK